MGGGWGGVGVGGGERERERAGERGGRHLRGHGGRGGPALRPGLPLGSAGERERAYILHYYIILCYIILHHCILLGRAYPWDLQVRERKRGVGGEGGREGDTVTHS